MRPGIFVSLLFFLFVNVCSYAGSINAVLDHDFKSNDEIHYKLERSIIPILDPIGDATECGEYRLLPITGSGLSGNQAYYTAPGGTGTQYMAGTYINSSTLLYAFDSEGGSSSEVSFMITIIEFPVIDLLPTITACDDYTLPAITGTGTTGAAYYTQPDGTGTQYQPGDVITTSTTLYIIAVQDEVCFSVEMFIVTILDTPVLNLIQDVTACDEYVLLDIDGTGLSGNEAYYTAPGGTGIQYNSGDLISNSTTLYVYDFDGPCSAETSFTIVIQDNGPILDLVQDVTACNEYELMDIEGTDLSGNEAYYTGPGGTGSQFNSGQIISNSSTLYIYDADETCSAETSFSIEIQENPTDYFTLVDLYTLTNGDSWTNSSGWFSNCDPCGMQSGNIPWFGLSCNSSGIVNTISLSSNNLTGQLPSSLNTLEAILAIDVSNNNLTGSLPLFEPSQTILNSLRFDNNIFTGGIPASYGSITSLVDLTLYNNDLSGCYPQQLIGLCSNSNLQLTNALISDGNTNLTAWEDYCSSNLNACCPANLVINWQPVYDHQYHSSGDINLMSNLAENANITLSTGTDGAVNIESNITIPPDVTLTITMDGCN